MTDDEKEVSSTWHSAGDGDIGVVWYKSEGWVDIRDWSTAKSMTISPEKIPELIKALEELQKAMNHHHD